MINYWPFTDPLNRVHMSLNNTFVSGPYGPLGAGALGASNVVHNPYKRLVTNFTGTGPLTCVSSLDLWTLVDNPNTMDIIRVVPLPNAWPPEYYMYLGNSSSWVIFGFVLPIFQNYSYWDPSVMVSLFDVGAGAPIVPGTPAASTQHGITIAVAVVVPGAAVAVGLVAAVWLIRRNRSANSARLAINTHTVTNDLAPAQRHATAETAPPSEAPRTWRATRPTDA